MRSLSPLLFAGLASAAAMTPSLLQPRATDHIAIRSVSALGTLCPDETTYTYQIGLYEDVITIGFITNWVATSEPSLEGNCKLTVQLAYPPGCTKAKLLTTAQGFMNGDETVQGVLGINYKDPRGQEGQLLNATLINWHWSLTNPGIVWSEEEAFDGSVEAKGEEGADVSVDVDVNLAVEFRNEESMGGKFEFESITIRITDAETDDDWRGCT